MALKIRILTNFQKIWEILASLSAVDTHVEMFMYFLSIFFIFFFSWSVIMSKEDAHDKLQGPYARKSQTESKLVLV